MKLNYPIIGPHTHLNPKEIIESGGYYKLKL